MSFFFLGGGAKPRLYVILRGQSKIIGHSGGTCQDYKSFLGQSKFTGHYGGTSQLQVILINNSFREGKPWLQVKLEGAAGQGYKSF